MKKPHCAKYSIILLPLVFLWAGLSFERYNYANDPEYVYLMNALCMLDGQSVGLIEHPGTPLVTISAGAIRIMHWFQNADKEPIIEHALRNPGFYIEGIRKVLIAINVFLLLFLGWAIFRKTGSVWLALFFQIMTLISPFILEITWVKLTPDPLLFFITGIFTLVIFYYYHDRNPSLRRYVVLFGLITGAGLATKANFLPLLLFPLLALPAFRRKLAYLSVTLVSFVFFTIPAIPEYGRLFQWFRNMVTHSGMYGHGERKIIDLHTYFPNIKSILTSNIPVMVVLVLGAVTLIMAGLSGKTKNITREIRFLLSLMAVILFGVLLVAKHYGGNQYLLPVILLSGITLYFIITILLRLADFVILKRITIPAAVVLMAVLIVWNHPRGLIITNRQYVEASGEIDSARIWMNENYGDYTRLHYYIYSINPFTGLKFGNDYAKGKMMPYLKTIFPNTYFYELSSDTYTNWNAKTSLHEIVQMHDKRVIMLNAPADTALITEMERSGLPLVQVYKGLSQNMYILDTLKYTPPDLQVRTQQGETLHFGADRFSPEGNLFMGSDMTIFGPVNGVTSEKARSGPNSIKLDKSNPFAVDYILNDTREGELYVIEVWRKSDRTEGYLVLGAEKAENYYMATNETVIRDENGWELLRINLEITEAIAGIPLKLNLYNPHRRAAYFDDLTIRKYSPALNEIPM